MSLSSSHRFKEKTYPKLTYCDYCTKLLWGVAKQGVSCEGCGYNCHKKCSELVYNNCVRSLHIPTEDNHGTPGSKTSGRRVLHPNDNAMRVLIPPAIVSSSQPLQSLDDKNRTAAAIARQQQLDREREQQEEKAASAAADSSAKPSSRAAAFLEEAIISAAIRMSLPSGDLSSLPKNDHPPLTIQATTINFTRFVHKTTGLFWFQDRVEDILTWKDPWNTSFVLVLYCFVCIYPMLLFLLPQCIMATIMIYFFQQKSARQQYKILGLKGPATNNIPAGNGSNPSLRPIDTVEESYVAAQERAHQLRHHVYHDDDYSHLNHTPLSSSDSEDEERRSTGVQYLSNLQHIQNMMGDVSDAHDVLKPLFTHLDWSDEAEAIMIVQGTMAAFVGMSVVMWFVPWRWVFMFGGASGMLANSPWGKKALKELGPLGRDVGVWAKVAVQEYKQKKVRET